MRPHEDHRQVTDCVITEGAVVTPSEVLDPGYVAVSDGRITAVGPGRPPAALVRQASVIEGGGRWVVPGFIDVHVHGGDGAQVNGDSIGEVVASIATIARFHARHGTTSLLATAVSDTSRRLETTVEGVAEFMRVGGGGARVLGTHLEGPWLARAKMGAQNPATLRDPSLDELRRLLEAGKGSVRLVTIAPELPSAPELVAAAVAEGVRVAVGHTDATYEQVVAAFDAGASHATHLFNAMAPLHHRRPGPVAAALLDERVTLELLADLAHVHPAVLELVFRLAPGRVAAVSDAVQVAGLEPGNYELGGIEVRLEGSRVSLAGDPATLAGSALTMDRALRNLVEVAGLGVPEAVRAASTTPAAVTGMHDIGVIRVGAVADLALLGDDFRCEATMVGGHLIPPGA